MKTLINEMSPKLKDFLILVNEKLGEGSEVTRQELNDIALGNGLPKPRTFIKWLTKHGLKIGHRKYQLQTDDGESYIWNENAYNGDNTKGWELLNE